MRQPVVAGREEVSLRLQPFERTQQRLALPIEWVGEDFDGTVRGIQRPPLNRDTTQETEGDHLSATGPYRSRPEKRVEISPGCSVCPQLLIHAHQALTRDHTHGDLVGKALCL